MSANAFPCALLALVAASCAAPLIRAATPTPAADQFVARDGLTWVIHKGVTNRLEQTATLAASIRLQTNAVFRVALGKARSLREGQILLADGFLLQPDGSLAPVFDHYAMKNGQFLRCQDGAETGLSAPVVLPSGDRIDPSGWIRSPSGSSTRLMDGELLALDGQPLSSWDVVSRIGGRLRVQKEGALVEVPKGRSLMMNDGTKILPDGTLVLPGGATRKLLPGEYLLLPGVRRAR